MHPDASTRPRWALALRLFGSLLILLGLVLPWEPAQASPASAAPVRFAAPMGFHNDGDNGGDNGGSCGEAEQEEIVDCGANLDRDFDEPFAVRLLREVEAHMNQSACTDLLFDFWSQQICDVRTGECGKMNSGTPPPPGPKLASCSSSAQSSAAHPELDGPQVRDLGGFAEIRDMSSRDLDPPVPPPRL